MSPPKRGGGGQRKSPLRGSGRKSLRLAGLPVNIRVNLMDRVDEPVDETVDLITPSEEVVDPPAMEESNDFTEEMLDEFARLLPDSAGIAQALESTFMSRRLFDRCLNYARTLSDENLKGFDGVGVAVIDRADSIITDAHSMMDTLVKEREDLQSEMTNKSARILELEGQINDLQKELDSKDKELNRANKEAGHVPILQKEIDNYHKHHEKEMKDAHGQIKSLNNDVKKLENTVVERRNEIQMHVNARTVQKEEIDRLKLEVDGLKSELQKVKAAQRSQGETGAIARRIPNEDTSFTVDHIATDRTVGFANDDAGSGDNIGDENHRRRPAPMSNWGDTETDSDGEVGNIDASLYQNCIKEVLRLAVIADEQIYSSLPGAAVTMRLINSHMKNAENRQTKALFGLRTKALNIAMKEFKRLEEQVARLNTELEAAIDLQNKKDRATEVRNQRKFKESSLPMFKGDFDEFHHWWKLFVDSIDKTDMLVEEKFGCLMNKLQGDAKTTVGLLQCSAAGYATAKQRLLDRYGDTQATINSIIKDFESLPTISKDEDIDGFIKLHDRMQKAIGTLDELEAPRVHYEHPTRMRLMGSLPLKMKIEWHRKDENKTLEGVLKSMSLHICSLRQLGIKPKAVVEDNKKKSNNKSDNKSDKTDNKGGVTTNMAVGAKEIQPCVFCTSTEHRSFMCQQGTLEERTEKARKLCRICLTVGHRSDNCPIQSVCSRCKKYGHCLALCRQPKDFKRPKFDNRKKKPAGPTGSAGASSIDSRTVTLHDRAATGGGGDEGATGGIVVTTVVVTIRIDPLTGVLLGSSSIIMLATATVIVIGPTGRKRRCLCLFDNGSQRSFVASTLVKDLGLEELTKEHLAIASFGDHHTQMKELSVRRIKVRGSYPDAQEYYLPALEQEELVSLDPYTRTEFASKLVAQGKRLADDRYRTHTRELTKVEILIGSDMYWQLVSNESVSDGKGLTAVDSRFGWIINGAVSSNESATITSVNSVQTDVTEFENIEFDLNSFWALEHIGIIEATLKEPEILAPFLQQIEMGEDSRYVTSLPKRDDLFRRIPTYYESTKSRLESLLRRLRRDPKGMWEYHAQIMQYVTGGFVQRADPRFRGTRTYLPHHPVIRENHLTTKIRPVFDGSARGKGFPSLNDALEAGPNLNPDLLAVLLRFRTFPVCWIADITKAFLQIELRRSDAEAVRFLWVDDPSNPASPIIEYRWNRVPFGLTSSPFILRAVLMKHLNDYDNDGNGISRQLLDQLYVDDWISGAASAAEAKPIISKGIMAMAGAQMTFVKWLTNSPELKRLMPEQFIEQGSVQIGQLLGSTADPCKVLGMRWDTDTDEFYFDPTGIVEAVKEKDRYTKRQICSIQARLYDPMGLLSPVVMAFKLVTRAISQHQPALKWDDVVPDIITKNWRKLVKSLAEIGKLRIPRCVAVEGLEQSQVHIFCDASENGLGAVAYFRSKNRSCNLLASRSRIAPPRKTVSLPRLELIACEIGAHLAHYICQTQLYRDCEFIMWTDAMVAVAWIQGDPNRWETLVRNRVRKILTLTKSAMWNHCPGVENPADAVSRGLTAPQLVEYGLWKHGPEWLSLEPEARPRPSRLEEELGESEAVAVAAVKVMAAKVKEPGFMARLATAAHRYSRLKRDVAWIRRTWKPEPGIRKRDIMVQIRKKRYLCVEPLSVDEIRQAGLAILRMTQREAYPDEFDALKRGEKVSRRSRIAPLRPAWDTRLELIVVTGRMGRVLDHLQQEYLILLPDHPVTDTIIRDQHETCGHLGWSTVLAKIRTQFWPLKGMRQVKNILKRCSTCASVQSRRYAATPAHIPASRIAEPENPWDSTAVDLAGPYSMYISLKDFNKAGLKVEEWKDQWDRLYGTGVKGGKRKTATERALEKRVATQKNRLVKAWIALFTCGATRAVHIEVMEDLVPSTFQNALRRFMAVRSCHPTVMYSDNGGTFTRTAKQLQVIFHHPKIRDYLSHHSIEWKFSVSLAPWWNGWFERLIQVAKRTFLKIQGKQPIDLDTFRTLFHEVSKMINDRPLTYITNDGETIGITPAMLISGNRSLLEPDLRSERSMDHVEPQDFEGRDIVRRGRLAIWWEDWTDRYLKEIGRFGYERKGRLRCPEVGEMVLIENDDKKRMYWKKGVVTELLKGTSGEVHSVRLRTSEGWMNRALESLYPLELKANDPASLSDRDIDDSS